MLELAPFFPFFWPMKKIWSEGHWKKKKMKPGIFPFPFLLLIVITRAPFTASTDTIYLGQLLSGNQTLISQGAAFEMGFFSPGNTKNHYIGIWYKDVPQKTVAWVANRNQPVSDLSTSSLKLLEDGNLVIVTGSSIQIHLTNHTVDLPSLIEAVLLDSGNFIIRKRSNVSDIIWQSFDHPTDTWLPGANIGYNRITNERQLLVSWKDESDPSPGNFSALIEPNGTHFLLYNGSHMHWNTADWRAPCDPSNNFNLVSNKYGNHFIYSTYLLNNTFSRITLDATGQLNHLLWIELLMDWVLLWTQPAIECRVYPFCGASASCYQSKVPVCEFAQEYVLDSRSEQCTRNMTDSLKRCNRKKDTFFFFYGSPICNSSASLAVENIEACRLLCLSNCSCTAYTYIISESDSLCNIYTEAEFHFELSCDLMVDFFIRINPSALDGDKRDFERKREISWVIALTVVLFGISSFVGMTLLIIHMRRAHKASDKSQESLILFKYSHLKRATKNFSEKIGEGSFGAVFKGTLPDSTAIAVKRHHYPSQGEKQFRAEVRSIGSLQHVNLVCLRGFCAEGSKRFLVFDYMSNGSLASHLFHDDISKTLDWKTRYNIAIGTAKGLAYLHEECCECIIHCDIKPDNILLDNNFQPTIADFGLAKLFGRDASWVITTMRGTLGYFAPEWISGCPITTKVDVFSYGKVLFKIISGKRNIDLMGSDVCNFFPFQVADKIVQGEEIGSLLDDKLKGLADMEQLERACRVACWCTQDNEKDRPFMSQVVHFLEGLQDPPMPPIPLFFRKIVESRS